MFQNVIKMFNATKEFTIYYVNNAYILFGLFIFLL